MYRIAVKPDEAGLKKDIENQLQHKVLRDDDALCIFSLQLSDLFMPYRQQAPVATWCASSTAGCLACQFPKKNIVPGSRF